MKAELADRRAGRHAAPGDELRAVDDCAARGAAGAVDILVTAVPEAYTSSRPPASTTVALATPPLKTCWLPPALTVVPLATPGDAPDW